MQQFFAISGAVAVLIILIPFYRVQYGPTVFDRLLAAAAISSKTLVIVAITGHAFGRFDMFADITLAYAILNFIGAVAVAKYFERGTAS
jgi:multicomponent Na+:H+ antiporter subunit F